MLIERYLVAFGLAEPHRNTQSALMGWMDRANLPERLSDQPGLNR